MAVGHPFLLVSCYCSGVVVVFVVVATVVVVVVVDVDESKVLYIWMKEKGFLLLLLKF